MHKLLKISQQTFWQVVVKVITTIAGFIIIGIISRHYGQSGVGDFTLALTYLTFFYTLADFGFNAEVLKHFKKDSPSLIQTGFAKLLGARLLWSLFLGLLSLLVVFILPSQFSNDFKVAVFLGSLIIVLFSVYQTSAAVYQFNHRYDIDIIPTIIGVIAGTLLIYVLGLNNFPVGILILGYLLSWFLHTATTLLLTFRLIKPTSPILDFEFIKNLFKKTWPLAGTLILNIVYFRIDSFILTANFGSSQVGLYNIAYQVFQSILVLPTFIMNALYPMILESKAFAIKKPLLGLLGMSMFITVIIYYFAPFLIQLIAGNGFGGSVQSLRILSFGIPAFFVSSLLWWVIISKGNYKRLLLIYAIGLMFNVAANLFFIPRYGFVAASWITGISEYLILILQVAILARR